MKFSDSIKTNVPERVDEAVALSEWPKAYYEEKNPAERLRLLNAAIAAGSDPESDALRKQIFDRRYESNKYADGGYADNFMRCFMEFSMITKSRPTRFGMKRARKSVLQFIEALGINTPTENETLYESLLLDEFRHLGQLFIALSADSKQYRAFILGIGHISDKALIQKLHTDLASAGKDIADMFDLHQEMRPWLRGLDEARAIMLPQTTSLLL